MCCCFLVKGYVFVFILNGQVYYYWIFFDFCLWMKLNKFYECIFVVVEIDNFLIELCIVLFMLDCFQFLVNEVVLQFEDQVVNFFDNWYKFVDVNNQFVCEVIFLVSSGCFVFDVGCCIVIVFKVKGFNFFGFGSLGGGGFIGIGGL